MQLVETLLDGMSADELILRDITTGLTYVITLVLLVFGWFLYKKSSKKVSGTLGLAIYFVTFGIYIFLGDQQFLLSSVILPISIYAIGVYSWVVGMIFFIYTVEHDLRKVKGRIFPLTLVAIGYAIIASIIIFMLGVEITILFIGLAVVLLYISYIHIDQIERLEIAKRSSPKLWFILGMIISGFANFLITFGNYYPVMILKNSIILVGALMLAFAWSRIPNIEELDWMLSLNRLLVIHNEKGISLVDFQFKSEKIKKSGENGHNLDTIKVAGSKSELQMDSELVAGAMTGISSLIGEILATSGDLDQIKYGDKQILFNRRDKITGMIIIEKPSFEIRYRLESFTLNFEKRFYEELKSFRGQIKAFSRIDDLIRNSFG